MNTLDKLMDVLAESPSYDLKAEVKKLRMYREALFAMAAWRAGDRAIVVAEVGLGAGAWPERLGVMPGSAVVVVDVDVVSHQTADGEVAYHFVYDVRPDIDGRVDLSLVLPEDVRGLREAYVFDRCLERGDYTYRLSAGHIAPISADYDCSVTLQCSAEKCRALYTLQDMDQQFGTLPWNTKDPGYEALRVKHKRCPRCGQLFGLVPQYVITAPYLRYRDAHEKVMLSYEKAREEARKQPLRIQ